MKRLVAEQFGKSESQIKVTRGKVSSTRLIEKGRRTATPNQIVSSATDSPHKHGW